MISTLLPILMRADIEVRLVPHVHDGHRQVIAELYEVNTKTRETGERLGFQIGENIANALALASARALADLAARIAELKRSLGA